jgi:hypothetical protein
MTFTESFTVRVGAPNYTEGDGESRVIVRSQKCLSNSPSRGGISPAFTRRPAAAAVLKEPASRGVATPPRLSATDRASDRLRGPLLAVS